MRVFLRASTIALATSLILAGTAGAQASQSPPAPAKIGYINSAQLLAQAPGRAEAEAQFDREVGVYRQQIQRMDDSLKTMMTAFDRDASKLDSTTREIPGNGIDDDGNGYVDDISGWDFYNRQNNPHSQDVTYGHHNGQMLNGEAAINDGGNIGACPLCMVMPIRAGEEATVDRLLGAHPALANARERLPVLRDIGFEHYLRGPESFTPDANFHLGEFPEAPGLWIAAGFNSQGIIFSPGAGKALAEWIVAGHPTMDLTEVDIARTGRWANNRGWLHEKTSETLGRLYAMHWPALQPSSGRGVRRLPLEDRFGVAGAAFGEAAGFGAVFLARQGIEIGEGVGDHDGAHPLGPVQPGERVGVLDQAGRAAQCPPQLVHHRQVGAAGGEVLLGQGRGGVDHRVRIGGRAGPNHGRAQDMRSRHHPLSPDTRHANVKAFCHRLPP